MDIIQQITVENKQILCQAQIQSLEILAMDAVELSDFLQNEYLSNPLLEYTPNQEIHRSMEEFSNWYDTQHTNWESGEEKEEKYDKNLVAPDKELLKKHLVSQMDISQFSQKEWELVMYLIDCLEDDGYFRMSVEEAAELTGEKEETIEDFLTILRELEPIGVFSPDLPHCLLKQLEAQGEYTAELEQMILHYLTEISEGKISVISRSLGLSTAEVRKNIARISKLNPRPLSGFRDEQVNYIVPDIIYIRRNGEWEIKVNDSWSGNYHMNDYYYHMMRESKDPELFEYFRKKLERSRFILNSVEQRHETMQSISKAILERQMEYFEGTGKLKPMTMSQLAQELDMHPSTVSRAIKGKYLSAPGGTILIKKLFSNTVSSCVSGEDVSANQIKERLKDIVDNEDKRKPYSDAKLVELLKEEGIQISRRAVAKYRDELWIKSSFDRKIR